MAVKYALLSAGAAATALPMAAMAQDNVEEVVVTGSRIPRADLDSASPVTVIDSDDIALTGIMDVGDVLQRLPSMSGSPIGTTTNNGGNGAVLIDLRGLGTIRTLTLVNGKRVVDGGDYQTIPAAMIERVEILKDGASAVYGADAVAGVVNIITRKDFEGVEINAQTSDFFDMDNGAQRSIGLVAGKTFAGGNFVFGAEYVDQDEAYQRDAPWDFFQDSWFIYPSGCEAQVTAPYDGTPQGGCYPVGSSRIPEGRLAFDTQGTFMNEDGSGLVPYDGRTYNYAPVNYIQTPFERLNVFGEANFDLTDNIRLKAELRANQRRSAQELAPQPYNSPTDPAYDGFRADGTPFSGVSQDNFYLVQAATAAGLMPEPVVDARRRMVETTRRFEQEINQVQATLGLEGEFSNGWVWDAYANRGTRNRTDRDFGQFFGPNLALALGPSADVDGDGSPECLADINDPTSVIAGCVPFNLFGGAGTITPAMLNYVGVDLVDSFVTKQMQLGGSVAGSAFELPGGDLGWAVGYEYRWEDFVFAPDSAKQQDAVTGNTGAGTEGGFHVNSFFVEVLAPLYDNGEQSLELTLGGRLDDFSTFGDDTTFQAGVDFQVVDSLKLRLTSGEVFRAPSIGELFAGVVDSFPTYNDPCDPTNNADGQIAPNCAGTAVQLDTQVLARVGGNPDLGAETGDTITAGVVWTPEFGNIDMSLTVDYWKTEIENVISSLGVNFILEQCHFEFDQNACNLITRRGDFSIAAIQDAALNIAESTAEGVDLEFRIGFDTDFGRWDGSFLWARMLDRSRVAFPGDETEQLEGRYTNPGAAWAEDKINYTIGWSRDDLRISLLGEFIGELEADVSFIPSAIQNVDSQHYLDLIGSYNLNQTNTNITLGITNLTDEPPPYIDFGFNASTDPSTYRLFGRGYYLRINQSF